MSQVQKKPLDWSGCPIITRVPGLMGGSPVIRGMRITPEAILVNWESGLSVSEIHELFPGVDEKDMQTIVDYAEKHDLSAHQA